MCQTDPETTRPSAECENTTLSLTCADMSLAENATRGACRNIVHSIYPYQPIPGFARQWDFQPRTTDRLGSPSLTCTSCCQETRHHYPLPVYSYIATGAIPRFAAEQRFPVPRCVCEHRKTENDGAPGGSDSAPFTHPNRPISHSDRSRCTEGCTKGRRRAT